MLPLQTVCVCCYSLFVPYNVGYIPKSPPPQRYNVTPDFSPPLQRYDISFPCSCAVVGVLRWINTYYLCAVFVPGMYGYCLSVDIFYYAFSLIQSFMFRYVILDLVYYFNRTLYR